VINLEENLRKCQKFYVECGLRINIRNNSNNTQTANLKFDKKLK
jgi:hypothetical protein